MTRKIGLKVFSEYEQQNEFKIISINAHFLNPSAQVGYVDGGFEIHKVKIDPVIFYCCVTIPCQSDTRKAQKHL